MDTILLANSWWVAGGILAVALLLALTLIAPFKVSQEHFAVVSRFDRYVRARGPGLRFRIRGLEKVVGFVDMRQKMLPISVATVTEDGVGVDLKISIQYGALESKIKEAHFGAQNPDEQIAEQARNAALTTVPSLKLEQVFGDRMDAATDTLIATRIRNNKDLAAALDRLGRRIVSVLVTAVEIDEKVRDALNRSKREGALLAAATAASKRTKIELLTTAEAESEARALMGLGMAKERHAIMEGLETSVGHFVSRVPGTTPQDVMTLVILTQYFDTLTQLGRSGANTVYLPHSPGAVTDLADQIRNSMIIGHGSGRSDQSPSPKPFIVPAPDAVAVAKQFEQPSRSIEATQVAGVFPLAPGKRPDPDPGMST